MLDPANVPVVGSNERLSRFVLSKRHLNRQDPQNILLKGDAFVPHPHEELSVTRDLVATEDEIWAAGRDVAEKRGQTLYGRGDAIAATYHSQKLKTIKAPVDGNPNHVNVTDWPSADDKPAQMQVALEIAAVAKFVPTPQARHA